VLVQLHMASKCCMFNSLQTTETACQPCALVRGHGMDEMTSSFNEERIFLRRRYPICGPFPRKNNPSKMIACEKHVGADTRYATMLVNSEC